MVCPSKPLFTCGFNPRAHAGRDKVQDAIKLLPKGFNPRAHAGRDPSSPLLVTYMTCFNPRAHAGRDIRRFRCPLSSPVSIHAPTRGATPLPAEATQAQLSFNPRAHAGRDNGASTMSKKKRSFNPRAHAGRDSSKFAIRPSFVLFQSTRPRGARLHFPVPPFIYFLFQSTRPRGARLIHPLNTFLQVLFQSTRPRGARLSLVEHCNEVM